MASIGDEERTLFRGAGETYIFIDESLDIGFLLQLNGRGLKVLSCLDHWSGFLNPTQTLALS